MKSIVLCSYSIGSSCLAPLLFLAKSTVYTSGEQRPLNWSLQVSGQLLFRVSFLWQDVKGPQTVAFNLPNDERIVKDRGTSMVMLKNVSEAKYKFLLLPFLWFPMSLIKQTVVGTCDILIFRDYVLSLVLWSGSSLSLSL